MVDTVSGAVENSGLTFGAFIDPGGIDGLLHITDMIFSGVGLPSEPFKVAQKLVLLVLDINKEKERVSLGLKQSRAEKSGGPDRRCFLPGRKVKGKVTNLVPYGAFCGMGKKVSKASFTSPNFPGRSASVVRRTSSPSCQ